jgi:tetratricopeptide (TPR) repeat protein
MLITEKRLETIGVFIYNGSDRSVLRVRNTFNRKKIVLNPYEKKAIIFEPTRSFPFTKYIYNIAIKSRSGQGSFVNILTDPKRITNALLEIGEWEEAISILSKSGPLDKEGWSLLGLAYSMGGRSKEALDAFRKGLSPSARELFDGNGWEKAFEKFTNIDSAFLIDSLTVNYNVDQFQQLVGRKLGWMAHFDPRFDKPGFLLFGPYKKFPEGHFKAIFKIRVIGSGESPAARIDVNNEDTILAERIIKDTKGKVEEFSLNFYNDEPDRPIEFRVNALGKRELWVEEIKVFPDLQNHYKRFFGMIYHYWGLSAGDSGLREEAVEHFKIAGLLGNNDTEGLYQMAKVYEKMGMEDMAMVAYKKVLRDIPNHIDSLLALRRLTSQGTTGLEERIKAITPGHEIKQNFGNSIEFLGYSIGRKFEPLSPQSSPLRGEGGEGEVFKVHPGEEFSISYFWRSLKRMRSNYSIFVHFRKAGAPVFQNDHSPSLQMTKWKVGSVVRYNYTVTVPPDATAGRYEIVIGLWDTIGSKERIKLKGKTVDELKVGSIEVLGMPSSYYRKDK